MDAVLVDHDRFELHNFEEHFLRDRRFDGRLKALILADVLDEEFPNQSFRGISRNIYQLRPDVLVDLIETADVILACTGDPEANKYICSLAGNQPVVVTGVYADDEDLRGFVFISRHDGMCLSCWDDRDEVAGRRAGESSNFRQTAASAVDVATWIMEGVTTPSLCLLLRSEGETLTSFRWVRGETNPNCPHHESSARRGATAEDTAPLPRVRVRPGLRPPRLRWWSVLRLLPGVLLFASLDPKHRSTLLSAIAHLIQFVSRGFG